MDPFSINLSLKQIEQAFQFLVKRYQPLPKELEHLNNQEWDQLEYLLENLQHEQRLNTVH